MFTFAISSILIVLHYSCSSSSSSSSYHCCRLYTCRPLRPSLQHFLPLPAVSLHALSILTLLTCRFHYPPFPYRIGYTLLPLLAHSIDPIKCVIRRFHYTRIQSSPQGRQKCAKNVLKWRTFKLTAWITGKRLKIDGYMLRGFDKHWILFRSNIYRDCPRGVTRGGQNVHIAADNSLLIDFSAWRLNSIRYLAYIEIHVYTWGINK